MKKMIFVAAMLTVAVVVMSAVASAQGPGGGRGGAGGFGGFGVGIGAILRNADCKALLGITDEQAQKIDQINQESRAAAPARGNNAGPPSAADRAEMEKRMQETQDKLKAVLSAEQQEKVKVLLFQVSGGLDAGASTVATLEALGLTDDQKAKIKAINDERAARGAGGQVDADQRRARAEETRSKIKAVLTDDQKAKAAKLTEEGKEIREKFQQPQRQGGGQGRGNRGGGN